MKMSSNTILRVDLGINDFPTSSGRFDFPDLDDCLVSNIDNNFFQDDSNLADYNLDGTQQELPTAQNYIGDSRSQFNDSTDHLHSIAVDRDSLGENRLIILSYSFII